MKKKIQKKRFATHQSSSVNPSAEQRALAIANLPQSCSWATGHLPSPCCKACSRFGPCTSPRHICKAFLQAWDMDASTYLGPTTYEVTREQTAKAEHPKSSSWQGVAVVTCPAIRNGGRKLGSCNGTQLCKPQWLCHEVSPEGKARGQSSGPGLVNQAGSLGTA